MKKINAVLLTFFLGLMLSVSPAHAQESFWCKYFNLGCPPPAQSVATSPDATGTSVPFGVDVNGRSLASYSQAQQIVGYLNAHLINQVIPGDDSANPGHTAKDGTLGIYVPLFTGPGISAPKTVVDGVSYYYIHLRFDNKADINAGLVIDKFKRHPSNPDYVLAEIAKDAKTAVKQVVLGQPVE